MKRLTGNRLAAFILCSAAVTPSAWPVVSVADTSRVSLFEYATKIPKPAKVFNLDLELHGGFYLDWAGGESDQAAFRFKDIKLDITGEVTDRLFYWYRQKLNGAYENEPLDNLSESIEYAYIGYRLSDRFTLTAGKQDVFFGGFEYDPNPLFIYEYSDMNEYSLCYLTGVGLAYQAAPAQEFRLQITNSRSGTMEQTYGLLPDGVEAPKIPLLYTLNWNSGYFDEAVDLRYSVSAGEQAQHKYMYNFFAGHSLDTEPWYAYFDVMYSRGALDPLGILTEETAFVPREEAEGTAEDVLPVRLQNCAYLSLVAEGQYRVHAKWKLFAKGMYETASVYKTTGACQKGKYRTAWGYQAGLEFYPMADDNLHLFLMGSGRVYTFTERMPASGLLPVNTAQIALGLVYRLPLY